MSKDRNHHAHSVEQTEKLGALKIQLLNDQLRRYGIGGAIYMTDGIVALGDPFAALALNEVACFEDFTPDNDPCREHDCAVMTIREHRIMWKIDYYDQNLEHASPDTADATATKRVLTIMLAEEYGP